MHFLDFCFSQQQESLGSNVASGNVSVKDYCAEQDERQANVRFKT